MNELGNTKICTTKNGVKFHRVDFDNIVTIQNYGEDVETVISEIFLKSTEILPDEGHLDIDVNSFKKLSSFDEPKEEKEEKNPLVKVLGQILEKMNGKKEEKVSIKSYKEQYKLYLKSLNEIFEAIENQIKSGEEEYKLMRDIVNALLPLVEALDEIVKVGYEDLEEFKLKVEELSKQENIDLETQVKLHNYPHAISMFESKLVNLEKDVITYKNTIFEYCLQANQGTSIVEIQKSFISHKAILIAEGSLNAVARIHSSRLEDMDILNKSLNDIISNNASQIGKNASKANKIQVSQGISIDTLKRLDSSLKEGIKLMNESSTIRRQKQISDRKMLNEISERSASYQAQVARLASGEEKPYTLTRK